MMTQLADINQTVLSIDSTVIDNFPTLVTPGYWKVTMSYEIHKGYESIIIYEDDNNLIEGLIRGWCNNNDANIEEVDQHHYWKVANIIFNNIDYGYIINETYKKIKTCCNSNKINDEDYRKLNIFYYSLIEKYKNISNDIINITLKEGVGKLYDYYEEKYSKYRE